MKTIALATRLQRSDLFENGFRKLVDRFVKAVVLISRNVLHGDAIFLGLRRSLTVAMIRDFGNQSSY